MTNIDLLTRYNEKCRECEQLKHDIAVLRATCNERGDMIARLRGMVPVNTLEEPRGVVIERGAKQ